MMNANPQLAGATDLPQQYRTLLEIADAVTAHQDLSSLLQDLAQRLRNVVESDGINVLLYNEERQVMQLHGLVSATAQADQLIPELPLDDAPAGLVWQTQEPLLMRDLRDFESRYPKIIPEALSLGVQSAYVTPLTSAGRRLGALGFGSNRKDAYNAEQQAFLQQVAKLVAVALDNTLNFASARAAEAEARRRLEQLQMLLEINNAVVSTLDLRDLLKTISPYLRRAAHHDFAAVLVYDPATDQLRAHALDLPESALTEGGVTFSMDGTPSGLAFRTRQPVVVTREMLDQFGTTPLIKLLRAQGVQSGCSLPLLTHDRALGVLTLMSLREGNFSQPEVELLAQIASQIAIAVDNSLHYERTRQAEQEAKLQSDRLSLVLRINNAVVSQLDLPELLQVISRSLREVVHNDTTGIALYDAASHKLRMVMTDFPAQMRLVEESYVVPLEGSVMGLAFTSGQPVFLDEFDLERFPSDFTQRSYEAGLRSCGNIPLIAHGRKLGALGVASKRPGAFSPEDIELLCQCANQIALAVENSLNYERIRQAEQELARKLEHLRLMLKITNAVVSQLDLGELLQVISSSIREVLGNDLVGVSLFDQDSGQLRAFASDFPDKSSFKEAWPVIPLKDTFQGKVFTSGQAVFVDEITTDTFESDYDKRAYQLGYRSGGNIPLLAQGRKLGVLGFASKQVRAFSNDDKELLMQTANQVAIAVGNALNYERARKAEKEIKRQLERERLMLELNNAVVTQLDLRALARVTATRLREVLQHDVTGISLYDEATQQFRAYMFDLPANLPPIPEGTLMPLEGTVGGLAFHSGRPVFLERYEAEFLASEFDRRLMEAGIRSGGVIPLIAHDKKLGFLGVGSFRENAFSTADQELLGHIANQIAIAVENALNFERAHTAEQQARQQTEQTQLLLQVNNAIASALDLPSLFRAVSACLRQVFRHDYAVMGLYDEQEDILRVHLLDRGEDEGINILQEGEIATLVDTPVGLAIRSKQVVVTGPDYFKEFPSEVVRRAVSQGIHANCSAPLLRNDRVIGAMSIASKTESAFTKEDGELFMQIAGQVAIAVENALNFARAHAAEEEAQRQSQRRQLLLEINNAMVAQLDLRSLIQIISASLRRISRHDVVGLALYDPDTNELRAYAYDSLDKQFTIEEGTLMPLDSSLSGTAFSIGQPIFHDRIDEERFQSDFSQRFRAAGLKSGGVVPLIAHGRKLGTLAIASYREANLNEDEKELLCQVANQVALAVENALAFREIETLKNKLTSEKLYLEDEIRTQSNFEELIGESHTFRRILKQVETVAPTDSTVLIRGETGTGKELIARAIHALSHRRERTLVKINCAAIPTGLLESELFGHEKGAFTGAIAQRIGRFELAHRGSLLLDEVGDIPLELQSKLLRVLQEQEFERLGSTRTQRVDVRLIAATNCDLEQLVAEKKYRSDLFYRLNVFPITIPPLRERREDIPALTRFFTQKYARRLKKPITAISAEAMAALTAYHWPGNVRELEHFIERAVILSHGTELEVSLTELKASEPVKTAPLATLENAEREHILRALEETNWVIGGPNGAAAKLGMKRTTLQSRMQKLGIAK